MSSSSQTPHTTHVFDKLKLDQPENASPLVKKTIENLEQSLRGKHQIIELAVATLLGKGHLLLEGPPGTGKTSLAKHMALAFGGSFRRIQMTSDLLPSDVVGILRLKPGTTEFEFRPGPVFSNFVLADELNRTSTKTQSALLEAMAEGTVTIDGISHVLPHPFFVVATQNPLEFHGVYPLAESQLDRFMTLLHVSTPEREDERKIYQKLVENPETFEPGSKPDLQTTFTPQHTLALCLAAERVHVEKSVLDYATDIIRATREHTKVSYGVSIRGGMQYLACAKALALVRGRNFVKPQDLKDLAIPTLSHRLCFLDQDATLLDRQKVICEVLDKTPCPR